MNSIMNTRILIMRFKPMKEEVKVRTKRNQCLKFKD